MFSNSEEWDRNQTEMDTVEVGREHVVVRRAERG